MNFMIFRIFFYRLESSPFFEFDEWRWVFQTCLYTKKGFNNMLCFSCMSDNSAQNEVMSRNCDSTSFLNACHLWSELWFCDFFRKYILKIMDDSEYNDFFPKIMNCSSIATDSIDDVSMERTLCRENQIHKTFVHEACLIWRTFSTQELNEFKSYHSMINLINRQFTNIFLVTLNNRTSFFIPFTTSLR